jgi:hypothetical protein
MVQIENVKTKELTFQYNGLFFHLHRTGIINIYRRANQIASAGGHVRSNVPAPGLQWRITAIKDRYDKP